VIAVALAAAALVVAPPKPAIVQKPIPFGPQRRAEMAAYSKRHYGTAQWRLIAPKVIVEHYTAGDTFASAYNTFAPDHADSELHELPNVCAHFVIDKDGTIYQLVPLSIRCRHTVGLNDTAIGIEQVGMSAQEILNRPKQVAAIVALSAWLRCRYDIKLSNVIGHAESLSSPYHHEDVASLRTQTHSDWTTPYARQLRKKIGAVACS
jgi:beta-N-acetylhexosaminidase